MLILGNHHDVTGDVTRLGRIGGRSPRLVEQDLGYGPGRLAKGYWIGVLKEALRTADIEFGGLTIRSGGREGLPASDPQKDKARKRVHQRMLDESGPAYVDGLRAKLVNDPRNLVGNDRIIKFFPVIAHIGENPASEYPMGGGSPQFRLTGPHRFLIAVEVTADFIARTAAGWSVSVAENAPYEARARLARYLAHC